MGVIAFEPKFGEQPKNLSGWTARARPEKIKELVADHQSKHPGGIPERDVISDSLRRAIAPCDVRNRLAHGNWWAFDSEAGTMTVRAGIDWPGAEQHRDFTVAEIQSASTTFGDLEVELYKLQRQIEGRMPRPPRV